MLQNGLISSRIFSQLVSACRPLVALCHGAQVCRSRGWTHGLPSIFLKKTPPLTDGTLFCTPQAGAGVAVPSRHSVLRGLFIRVVCVLYLLGEKVMDLIVAQIT